MAPNNDPVLSVRLTIKRQRGAVAPSHWVAELGVSSANTLAQTSTSSMGDNSTLE